MRLGIKPTVFLLRLLIVFALTYVLWTPFAPVYTRVLAWLTAAFLHLTELSSDPNRHLVTTIWVKGTGIFFQHRLFPGVQPPGIPADWVQANLVLLIPLMLATPAISYAQRWRRLGLALAIALLLQVLDLAVTIKAFYASQLGQYSRIYFGDRVRWMYQFADAFTEAMDTQLFPFVIWAGIHFRQLVGRADARPSSPVAAPMRAGKRPPPKRARAKSTAGGRA